MNFSSSYHGQSLQIHVLEHTGQHQDLVWHWPEELYGAITLDEVLQKVQGIDEITLEQARACKIERIDSGHLTVWWLTNTGAELNCIHNGLPLPVAQSVRLAQADDIEFALSHLKILLSEASFGKQHLPGIDDPLLEMSNLEISDSGRADGRIEPRLESSGFLVSTESAQESAAALTELINTHSVAGSFIDDTQESRQGDLDRILAQDFGAEKLSSILPVAVTGNEAVAKKNRFPVIDDPLEQLHQHYLARLRNPHLALEIAWQEHHVTQQKGKDDEFARLRKDGGTGSVHELLAGKENTYDLLASFDQFSDNDVLAPETFESVMHLFAPAELNEIASSSRLSTLPGLTRSEHHSMAIDSSMDSLVASHTPAKTDDHHD